MVNRQSQVNIQKVKYLFICNFTALKTYDPYYSILTFSWINIIFRPGKMKIKISIAIFLIFTTTATCNLKVENEDGVIGKFEIVDLPNLIISFPIIFIFTISNIK